MHPSATAADAQHPISHRAITSSHTLMRMKTRGIWGGEMGQEMGSNFLCFVLQFSRSQFVEFAFREGSQQQHESSPHAHARFHQGLKFVIYSLKFAHRSRTLLVAQTKLFRCGGGLLGGCLRTFTPFNAENQCKGIASLRRRKGQVIPVNREFQEICFPLPRAVQDEK